jgi:hypothetical protein
MGTFKGAHAADLLTTGGRTTLPFRRISVQGVAFHYWRTHQHSRLIAKHQVLLQDMDLVFYNCELYNGIISQVGKYGQSVKRAWAQAWSKSTLNGATLPASSAQPLLRQY